MKRTLLAVFALTAFGAAACGYPYPYAGNAPVANENPNPSASPSVMNNCEPLTPAALEAIPAVPRGHFEGLDSSGSL